MVESSELLNETDIVNYSFHELNESGVEIPWMRTYNLPANETICSGFHIEPLIVKDPDYWEHDYISLGVYPMSYRAMPLDDVAYCFFDI